MDILSSTTVNNKGNIAGEGGAPPADKDTMPPLHEKAAPPEETPGATAEIRPRKSVLITQVFHVPLEQCKHQRGDQARICAGIMRKTGAQLELYLTKDQGISIMVSGNSDAVMKARREIVAQLHTQESITLDIPKEDHCFVIGKNGKRLQELQLKTDTTIEIPGPANPSNQIKISGPNKDGVEKAKHEILLISAAEQAKIAVERLNISKVYHPFITGAYNKLVQKIMQDTGARIHVPPRLVDNTMIVISGRKQQVVLATAMIKQIYEDKKKRTTSIAVELKKVQHKFVIGPKGKFLQEILDKTGVSVEIPPPTSTSQTVILRGEPGRLVQALTEVFVKASSHTVSAVTGKNGHTVAKISQQTPKENNTEIVVSIPTNLHTSLIGPKGCFVRSVMEECGGVHIRFPTEASRSNKVTIRGNAEGVEKAKQQLLALAEEKALSMFRVTMTVDPKYFAKIIGSKGSTVTGICTEHEVKIHFPRRNDQHQDQITITGHEEKAIAARDAIQAIVDHIPDVIYKQILLDSRVHGRIIGTQGKGLKIIMNELKVNIRFPRREAADPDVVTVSGPTKLVDEAVKHLLDLADNYVEDLELKLTYLRPPRNSSAAMRQSGTSNGFFMTEAPQTTANDMALDLTSNEAFPCFGATVANKNHSLRT